MTSPALPTPADLTDADKALHSMQRMLMNMGQDPKRRSLPEFQDIMASYKHLGGNLHVLRGMVNEAKAQQARALAQQQQMERLKQAGTIGQPRAAYRPPQAVAGASLINKVKQLQAERGIVPVAPTLAPSRSVAAAYARPPAAAARPAAPAPTTQDAAGSMRQAQLAYRPPQLQASAAMVEKLQELHEEYPEGMSGAAAQSSLAAAPASPEPEPFEVPVREPDALPPGIPLAMPRFVSTLGMASTRAISKGPEVGRLQQLLTVLGFETAVTETFDARTFRAVNDFQKDRCLAVNGMIGLETRKVLNELVTG